MRESSTLGSLGARREGAACVSLACADAVALRYGRANTFDAHRTLSPSYPQTESASMPAVMKVL